MALADVTKFCPGCSVTRPGRCFGRDRSRRDGLDEYCSLCRRAKQRASGKCAEWYASEDNRQRHIESARRSRERNRYRPDTRKRPRRMVHLLAPEDKTLCGWPAASKRYDTVTAAEIGSALRSDATCRRCRQAYEVIWNCTPLTPDQVATAARYTERGQ